MFRFCNASCRRIVMQLYFLELDSGHFLGASPQKFSARPAPAIRDVTHFYLAEHAAGHTATQSFSSNQTRNNSPYLLYMLSEISTLESFPFAEASDGF